MTLAVSPAQKAAASNGRKSALDADTAPAVLRLYPAPRPAAGAAPGVAQLVAITLTKPCGTVDASGLHLTQVGPGQVGTGGTIAWGRIEDGAGVWQFDGDAADTGTPEFLLDQVAVLPGAFVSLVSALIAEGG